MSANIGARLCVKVLLLMWCQSVVGKQERMSSAPRLCQDFNPNKRVPLLPVNAVPPALPPSKGPYLTN